MLTDVLMVMMCGKFCGLRGCGADQEFQDTVRDFSLEQVNACSVLINPSGQCKDFRDVLYSNKI